MFRLSVVVVVWADGRRQSSTVPTYIHIRTYVPLGAGIAQSVQRLVKGWTFRGSNPGGGEIFRTRPAHPASYTMGTTGSFVGGGVKRPGHGVDHPDPHHSAEVEVRVELYICSPLWAFVACYRVTFTFTFYVCIRLHGVTPPNRSIECRLSRLPNGWVRWLDSPTSCFEYPAFESAYSPLPRTTSDWVTIALLDDTNC
jgi:hypothetical protein